MIAQSIIFNNIFSLDNDLIVILVEFVIIGGDY